MAVEIRGLDQLKRNVAALTQHVELRAALAAVEAGAEVFQRGMALRAPRDTGQLAADIVVEIALDKRGYVAKIGPSRHSFYGSFLEFGTVHRAAHPFARPTLDEERQRANQTMDVTFRRAIEALTQRMTV